MAADTSEDDEPEPEPGYREYLIFCDDSGLHGSTHYGFGALWIPLQRRGDLQSLVREARGGRAPDEIKWNKVKRGTERFYVDLVDRCFREKWIMFHALVVKKETVDKDIHQ